MENGFSFKTLAPSADPMGAAIAEYFKTGKAANCTNRRNRMYKWHRFCRD